MIQELIFTSARRGLQLGKSGFCTVASTAGMAENVARLLESLSGYRHLFPPGTPEAAANPVNFSHLISRVGGKDLHIFSRVADAGLDYSGRSNKLAHHIACDSSELPPGGPAALLRSQPFETRWDREAERLPPRKLSGGSVAPGICATWERVTGDAGWGGALAEAGHKKRPAVVIVGPGAPSLELVLEALALLPENVQEQVTFSTFYTNLPANVQCLWRFVLADSPEAAAAKRNPQNLVIDCTAKLGVCPSPAADEARQGRRYAPKVSIAPPVPGKPVADAPLVLADGDAYELPPALLGEESAKSAPPPAPYRMAGEPAASAPPGLAPPPRGQARFGTGQSSRRSSRRNDSEGDRPNQINTWGIVMLVVGSLMMLGSVIILSQTPYAESVQNESRIDETKEHATSIATGKPIEANSNAELATEQPEKNASKESKHDKAQEVGLTVRGEGGSLGIAGEPKDDHIVPEKNELAIDAPSITEKGGRADLNGESVSNIARPLRKLSPGDFKFDLRRQVPKPDPSQNLFLSTREAFVVNVEFAEVAEIIRQGKLVITCLNSGKRKFLVRSDGESLKVYEKRKESDQFQEFEVGQFCAVPDGKSCQIEFRPTQTDEPGIKNLILELYDCDFLICDDNKAAAAAFRLYGEPFVYHSLFKGTFPEFEKNEPVDFRLDVNLFDILNSAKEMSFNGLTYSKLSTGDVGVVLQTYYKQWPLGSAATSTVEILFALEPSERKFRLERAARFRPSWMVKEFERLRDSKMLPDSERFQALIDARVEAKGMPRKIGNSMKSIFLKERNRNSGEFGSIGDVDIESVDDLVGEIVAFGVGLELLSETALSGLPRDESSAARSLEANIERDSARLFYRNEDEIKELLTSLAFPVVVSSPSNERRGFWGFGKTPPESLGRMPDEVSKWLYDGFLKSVKMRVDREGEE